MTRFWCMGQIKEYGKEAAQKISGFMASVGWKKEQKSTRRLPESSGRRQNLSSGAFRSEFPFGSGLGQTEKLQNSPSEKVRNMQKNPAEIGRFQPDLVGVSGFEPEASWSRTKRDTKLRHTPLISDFSIICLKNTFVKCFVSIYWKQS